MAHENLFLTKTFWENVTIGKIEHALADQNNDINAIGKNKNTVLHYAVHSATTKISHAIAGSSTQYDSQAKVDVIKFLVSCGADINAKNVYGSTPVLVASVDGYVNVASALIDSGADINIANNAGDTPLHFAKTSEVAQLLIEHKIDINIKNNDGDTPLHIVASDIKNQNSTEKQYIAEVLLSYDLNVDEENNAGNTALHLAVLTENVEVMKILLKHKADVNAQNRVSGYTPLDLALQFNETETLKNIKRMLLMKGSVRSSDRKY